MRTVFPDVIYPPRVVNRSYPQCLSGLAVGTISLSLLIDCVWELPRREGDRHLTLSSLLGPFTRVTAYESGSEESNYIITRETNLCRIHSTPIASTLSFSLPRSSAPAVIFPCALHSYRNPISSTLIPSFVSGNTIQKSVTSIPEPLLSLDCFSPKAPPPASAQPASPTSHDGWASPATGSPPIYRFKVPE